jgi:hypothetical protein
MRQMTRPTIRTIKTRRNQLFRTPDVVAEMAAMTASMMASTSKFPLVPDRLPERGEDTGTGASGEFCPGPP